MIVRKLQCTINAIIEGVVRAYEEFELEGYIPQYVITTEELLEEVESREDLTLRVQIQPNTNPNILYMIADYPIGIYRYPSMIVQLEVLR